MNRFVAVIAVIVLFIAGCSVDRESEDALETDVVSSDADRASEEGTGDDGGAGDDGASVTTTTAAPFAPPTTGAPDDVALSADFGDSSWEITHGELNDLVVPTQENETFVNLVFQGVPPPDFTITVLSENLFAEAVRTELAANGGEISDEGLATSQEGLIGQVEGLLGAQPDPAGEAQALFDSTPYLGFLVEYQAAQDALTNLLSETADPADGIPCVSHILLETEADAQAVLDRLAAGEDFAELAVETSTGPSGPSGGDLGCAPSTQYVLPFAEAVDGATIGEFVGPVETEFGFHVLVVNRTEVDGRTLASELLQARVENATVTVDPALGTWDATSLSIVPAQP